MLCSAALVPFICRISTIFPCLLVTGKIGNCEGDETNVTSGREAPDMASGEGNYCDKIALYGWFIEWSIPVTHSVIHSDATRLPIVRGTITAVLLYQRRRTFTCGEPEANHTLVK